jgi:lysine-N-methylase
MSISYKTPSYFSGFSCLGGECEDTCCRNWEVKLDREHFDLLESVMSEDDIEKSMFEQYVHINESSISSDHDYAFIRMGVNGYCAMLDDNGLCSIHAKHGVTVLGNVCTMFPRVISRCGDTIELSGALSCPEVVRNCIDDKTPLKLKRFKTSDLPRSKNYPIQRELLDLDNDAYSESFNLVRKNIMHVMANEELDLETRLYVMANLAHKISGFYHRDCAKLDEGRIEAVLEDLSNDEVVSKLDAFIKEYDASSPLSMIVVHSILSIKLQQANDENISQLYEKIINKYTEQNDNVAEVLAEMLVKIGSRIDAESKQYIDKAITRYILNCLYREWFVTMPDPFTYIQMLLVRTSVLRTLIYLDVGEEKQELHQLKQKVVYIMYNFARNIDQNLEFLKVVYNALSEQTMMNFDFSPAYIRLY